MKRITWIAIVCCLTATFGSNPLFAHGGGGGGGHGGGGGGHSGGGGGGGGHFGGGGGGAPHMSGGSGFSHPGGQISSGQPNFSGHSGVSASPQIGSHPNFNPNPSMGSSINHGSGQTPQAFSGSHLSTPMHFAGTTHTGTGHAGITQQNFAGNKLNLGNRPINLSSASYQPAYYRHGSFYHGYWNGNRGYGGFYQPNYGYGGGYGFGFGSGIGLGFGYGYGYPFFWGMGGWGLGSLMYGSGYLGYSNPYYNSGYGGYNYSQPIPVNYNQANAAANQTGQNTEHPADTFLNTAVAAFRQNDYDLALNVVNHGIAQFPDDAVLHEFRALVLFAKGDYQQAAATIHSVLAVGPGWDWTTMSGVYTDVSIYTAQLRALEGYVKQNPQNGSARFLLAYHYLTDGYPDAAARQLTQVASLVPNDQVAASLLKMTMSGQTGPATDSTGSSATNSTPQPIPQPPIDLPSPNKTNAPAVDPAAVVGNWKASRDDGSSFSLKLTGDKTFTWTYTPKQQQAQSFEGTYTLEGNVIALERAGGGSLVAELTSVDGSQFNFKMVGAPAEDPGLNFSK